MADLKIDYEKTRSVASAIKTNNSDFLVKLKIIRDTNNDLKADWEGTDASTYSTAVEEQIALVDQLSKAIEETGMFLERVANAYEEALNANVAGASGGGGGTGSGSAGGNTSYNTNM